MELKTRYQYTYYIYPYIIEEKKFEKYVLGLLKSKRCKLKLFDEAKDIDIYTHFLPKVRDYMFWSFKLDKNKARNFNSLDDKIKATLLSKKNCVIFEYGLSNDIQGKIDENGCIFFDINKMELICFNTGICFLVFKTSLTGDINFSDVLNFNYKFRDINSQSSKLKEYENIKIQTEKFKSIKDFSLLIKEITGDNSSAKELNIDTEKFITYSYCCLDQMDWNENTDIGVIEKEFLKYSSIQHEEAQASYNIEKNRKVGNTKLESRYIKYGFSNYGTVLLTSDINIDNYTKLPFSYENKYLYTYIFNLYKKIFLKKIDYELNRKKDFNKDKFIEFTKNIWIQEVTNDDTGKIMDDKWREVLFLDETYLKSKNKYDVLYKEYEVEKTKQNYRMVMGIVIALVIFNIVNIYILYLRK